MNIDYNQELDLLRREKENYFFTKVAREFTLEIDSHIRRIDAEGCSQELHECAKKYITSLANASGDLDRIREAYQSAWSALRAINRSQGRTIWSLQEFLYDTPIALEKKAERDLYLARCGSAHLKSQLREDSIFFSFTCSPSTIIAAAREVDALSSSYDKTDYLKTFSSFDRIIEESSSLYTNDIRRNKYREHMKKYTSNLQSCAGNLEHMGRVMRKYLNKTTTQWSANPRDLYIDPFWPDDFSKLTFPSAQADLVAARILACKRR
jgi:hypothetical protein